MAGVSTEQGSNKLNTELNLVPFIDLLSTLVSFLLVTAVWLQVAAIPASVDSKGKSTVSLTNQQKLLLHITANGYRMSWPAELASRGLPGAIGRTAAGYDFAKLTKILKGLPTTTKIPVAVSADDDIPYELLIQAIDAIKTAGGHAVALSTG